MGLLGTTHRAEDEQPFILLAVELRRPGALNRVHGMPYGTGLLKRNAIDIEYFAALNWNMLAIYDTNVLVRLHFDWADYSRWATVGGSYRIARPFLLRSGHH